MHPTPCLSDRARHSRNTAPVCVLPFVTAPGALDGSWFSRGQKGSRSRVGLVWEVCSHGLEPSQAVSPVD